MENIHKPPVYLPTEGLAVKQHVNDKARRSRLHYSAKLAQTILLRPITTTATLAFRTVKLLTYVPTKVLFCKSFCISLESTAYLKREYLKTKKAARDLLFIPLVAKRAFNDCVATREKVVDDINPMPTEAYLNLSYTRSVQLSSSYLHGIGNFEVIYPQGITEFPAVSDGALNTIMSSHLFKPGTMAINFGVPNVATFVTKEVEGKVQTVKVDAKSLYRAKMSYHETNGKIQSGVFFVPTNLPNEALDRFENAAKQMDGRKDFTCVNTNCRVLKEAGFSIEGVPMEKVIWPTTFMEHLLFRNVFYTDLNGVKHKVHFDIVNTTQHRDNLEEYDERVDAAVLSTLFRHYSRKADTNQEDRRAAAEAHIAKEKAHLDAAKKNLDAAGLAPQIVNLKQHKLTVSVPSSIGDFIARHFWGRHMMYEVDLSDKKDLISKAFENLTHTSKEVTEAKLSPE